MATKHDEFKVYYFSFDEDEIVTILAALRCHGEEEFADEISEQLRNSDEHEGDTAKLVFEVDTTDLKSAHNDMEKLTEAVEKFTATYESARNLGYL